MYLESLCAATDCEKHNTLMKSTDSLQSATIVNFFDFYSYDPHAWPDNNGFWGNFLRSILCLGQIIYKQEYNCVLPRVHTLLLKATVCSY